MKPASSNNLPKISQPAVRALSSAGIHTLEQVAALSDSDLLKLHGMGPQALGILREAQKQLKK